MKQKRPVDLAITSLRFPITAIVSLMHRLSGMVIFACLPFMLWAFSYAIASRENFNHWIACFRNHLIMPIVIWLVFISFLYHLLAGIRHLLMDVGIGENRCASHWSAKLTLIIWAVISILLGILLCLRVL